MIPQQDAIEHLRVIRSLLEKAPVYRAISAPAALIGALLALGTAAWQTHAGWTTGSLAPTAFMGAWLTVLTVTGLLNWLLLCREARQRDQPIASERVRTAMRALLPPFLVGGVTGCGVILRGGHLEVAALIWIFCYGLALLATASFSPRSLVRLGWAFVVQGLILFVLWTSDVLLLIGPGGAATPALLMGLTFGLSHLVYAIAVWLRQAQPEEPLS